jgi:hypothetical protein
MRLVARAAIAFAISTAFLGPAAAADGATGYNGIWTVHLTSEAGPCGGGSSYKVALRDGAAHYVPGASGATATISGRVSPSGSVALTIQRSIASGTAAGQLRANGGTGSWQVNSLGCSGRWTAQRSTTVMASKE